ncbi:MAG: hypothetical protein COS84_00910 [Armatimonadetes bacterium CG07_land_8_20_14_0_80_40_9]|nr:MAG: hypothetical protein COS84_00910 [Armatimonadetes bacterium CG07_land_8_20_14_0_80_40_9]
MRKERSIDYKGFVGATFMTPLKNPNARFHEHKEMARASLFDFLIAHFHRHKYPFSQAQLFDTI